MAVLYTIGHSTRTWSEFVELLQAHSIESLIDIRSFPASRRMPHFFKQAMEKALPAAGIRYEWWPALGGRRPKRLNDSPNLGLRSTAFRNYADYMLEDEFRDAADRLLAAAQTARLVCMCAEALYFRCHRMLVSDYLTLRGARVLHIQSAAAPVQHVPIAEAVWTGSVVTYPARQLSISRGGSVA
jgi:uncharacterized protein (DUF488 family)